MATLTCPRPWEPAFALAAGFTAAIVGSLLAAQLPADAENARLAVLAVVVAAGTAVTRDAIACVPAALMAWLFCDGFLIDHYGELHWHGWPDAVRLAVLTGAAVAGVAAGRTWVGAAEPPDADPEPVAAGALVDAGRPRYR